MKISDLLRFARERGEPVFSFEFFPPRTDEGVKALFETVEALRPLAPGFVSVTYGAGGSTRARTVELVKRLKRETEIEAMAHVTCVGASRDEIAATLDEFAEAGVAERAGAARRSAQGRDRLHAAPRRLPPRLRAGGLHPRRSRGAGPSASVPPPTPRATRRPATSTPTCAT